MKRWFLALAFVAVGSLAHAVPTVAEVQAEVQKGNFTQAQSMLREVVIAKPGSAKAHYLYAEILAHNSKFSEASREVAEAKRLDPTLKFTDAAKFDAFEQLLQREQRNEAQRASRNAGNGGNASNSNAALNSYSKPTQVAQRAPEPASGMPSWVLPVGLAILAVVGWRMYSKRRAAAAYGGMSPMQGMAPGMAPGTGMARYGAGAPIQAGPYGGYGQNGAPMGNSMGNGMGGGMGGGMMQPQSGGVGMMGVGLAAAGGVAAGMLAEKYLHGQSAPANAPAHDQNSFTNNNAQAPTYDADAQALNDRSIDFGNGNDWDSGSADAGSFDSSGGGGSDDNW